MVKARLLGVKKPPRVFWLLSNASKQFGCWAILNNTGLLDLELLSEFLSSGSEAKSCSVGVRNQFSMSLKSLMKAAGKSCNLKVILLAEIKITWTWIMIFNHNWKSFQVTEVFQMAWIKEFSVCTSEVFKRWAEEFLLFSFHLRQKIWILQAFLKRCSNVTSKGTFAFVLEWHNCRLRNFWGEKKNTGFYRKLLETLLLC